MNKVTAVVNSLTISFKRGWSLRRIIAAWLSMPFSSVIEAVRKMVMVEPILKESAAHRLLAVTRLTDVEHDLLVFHKEVLDNSYNRLADFWVARRFLVITIDY